MGGLTILMTEFIHKPIEHLVLSIPDSILTPVTLVLTALIGADFALSFKAALDLRDILEKMEKAKEDMLRIQKRLDVIIAVTSEDLENRKEGFSDSLAQKKEDFTASITTRVEDLKSNIEGKLESFRTSAQKSPNQYLESVKNEVAELRQKYTRSVADRENVSSLRDFFQRDMIRSNPTMSSEKFKEALEELKQHSNKKINNKVEKHVCDACFLGAEKACFFAHGKMRKNGKSSIDNITGGGYALNSW